MSPADRVTRREFVRLGRCCRRRLWSDGPVSRPSRQPGQERHEQDSQLQPRHGVSPLRPDQLDDLGRVHGRPLETDRHGGISCPPGLRLNRIGQGDREFEENRHEVVSRCIDRGINYIDACIGSEVRLQQSFERPPQQDALGLLLVRKGDSFRRPPHLQIAREKPWKTGSSKRAWTTSISGGSLAEGGVGFTGTPRASWKS